MVFADIFRRYSVYLKRYFGNCTVVFDGYDGHNTKDHEHMRRQTGTVASRTVIRLENEAQNEQGAFLRNSSNKVLFVQLLSDHLRSESLTVINSSGDADYIIAETSLKMSRDGIQNQVVAQDCDASSS